MTGLLIYLCHEHNFVDVGNIFKSFVLKGDASGITHKMTDDISLRRKLTVTISFFLQQGMIRFDKFFSILIRN